jgi:RNA polymerase sigma factor (sigma-70 family)
MTASTYNYDRYIQKLANKYSQDKFYDDLYQEGHIGLHLATQNYDEKYGDFHNYAQWYIVGRMKNYLTNFSRTVKIPASQLNKNNKSYNEDYQYIIDGHTISIDQQIGDEDKTYGDLYLPPHQPEEFKEEEPIIKLLRQYLDQLKERYQTILNLRYNEAMTLEEIAEKLNVTREAVRLQHDKAIAKLQELFNVEKTNHTKFKRVKVQKNFKEK